MEGNFAGRIILFLVFGAVNMAIARKKGFSPWAWILAAGILGLLAISFMPSSKEIGITEQAKNDRRKAGNLAGILISILALSVMVVFIIAMPSI
jgi:hypothetical protein